MRTAKPTAELETRFPSPTRTEDAYSSATPSVSSLVHELIRTAHERGASDIHIVPSSDHLRIRFRIDGVLQDEPSIAKQLHQEIISRIKILSALRTDEHLSPQDGRFLETLPDSRTLDIRVSIAATYHGENAVLRLLASRQENTALDALGFSNRDIGRIERALRSTSGMLLATGPTGSGKTTTLYTLLRTLNVPDVSITTIEDPIEYSLTDITQMQVHARSGVTFANGLRSVLRQDPDIIMVGEIRDTETAHIAVHAALTGHLLLSTLHTNSAVASLPRLIDMGIDPYLIASTVRIILGQRLVRTICSDCRTAHTVTAAMVEALASEGDFPFQHGEVLYTGAGCETCNGVGYRGRISINEVLVADAYIQEAILRRASTQELLQTAETGGMTTMREDGVAKVRAGITTIEEILRVTHE